MNIKSIEFHENGNVKRVEFEPESKQYWYPYVPSYPYPWMPPYTIGCVGAAGASGSIIVGSTTEFGSTSTQLFTSGLVNAWNTPEEGVSITIMGVEKFLSQPDETKDMNQM